MANRLIIWLTLTTVGICGCTPTLVKTGQFPFFSTKPALQTQNQQDPSNPDPSRTKAPSQPEAGLAHSEAQPPAGEETARADAGAENPGELDESAQISRMQAALDEALDFCKAAQNFWQDGRFDNAIQALDQAYALLLEADAGSDLDLIQQKEDIRFLISKRILEIYASRHTIVNGTHDAIPVTINDEVQKQIDYYTTGAGRRFFLESYRRSGKYRDFIIQKLEKAGLPEELAWLPLIESGFKPHALSKARALGLWQFIPSTGYKFGLERNMYIDERLDPEKATLAAIDYLKALHQIFGDWSTVLAAYNCGEGRVLRIIRTKNINYLDNFWDLYQQLPRETARYVPKFLATLHIINHLEKYDMAHVQPDPPVAYETVSVGRRVHLKQVARAIELPYADLIALNPELRHKVLPGKTYPLRVTPGKKSALLAKLGDLKISSPPQKKFVYHRVRRGESLSTIARRYRTSISTVARANNISHHNYIKAGNLLKIPLGRGAAVKTKRFGKVSQGPARHVVSRGESLWIIAKRYGTTVNTLKKANNLSTNTLRIGQELHIPGQPTDTKTYRVKRGDSPFTIALRHNMTLQQFLRLNGLTPQTKIYPGQTLSVK